MERKQAAYVDMNWLTARRDAKVRQHNLITKRIVELNQLIAFRRKQWLKKQDQSRKFSYGRMKKNMDKRKEDVHTKPN